MKHSKYFSLFCIILIITLCSSGCSKPKTEVEQHRLVKELWLKSPVDNWRIKEVNARAEKYDLVRQVRDKLMEDGHITVGEYAYINQAYHLARLLANEN